MNISRIFCQVLKIRHRFQQAHRRWIDDTLAGERMAREGRWSEAIAIGKLNFVAKVESELGFKAAHREVIFRFRR